VQEPEAAAGDAGDCGDGLTVGEAGAVPGEAELAVKPPISQLPQRALAAQAGRPRAATSVGPQPSQIYFGNEIQDSEPNILTPN
jgi:hypothetical protein